jgi:hypothetical protein
MRIFLEECPPELEALRERVACRQMVTRNVLALAAGVTLTLCWDLAPEIPHYRDRLNMLGFLSGTFALLDFDQGWGLTRERPAAKTLRMVSRQLTGASRAEPVPTDDPALSAYAIKTADGGTLHVLWREGDLLRGEMSPAGRRGLPLARADRSHRRPVRRAGRGRHARRPSHAVDVRYPAAGVQLFARMKRPGAQPGWVQEE